jgi:hypothetical protein
MLNMVRNAIDASAGDGFLRNQNSWRGITARLVELLDESREIRRDGRCERVILVPQRSPDRIKREVSVAGAINVAWSGSTVNNMPAYPVSCDS